MKTILLALLSVQSAFATTTLIQNVSVLDVEQKIVLSHQDVLLSNDKITSIAVHKKSSKLKSDRTIDGSGMFLTPGLMDTHIHMDLWHWEKQADEWSLPLYIANGVTTVRDCAGSKLTLAARDSVNQGQRVGPRMFIATPFIATDTVNAQNDNEYTVVTTQDAIARFGPLLDQGYDFVKTDYQLASPVYEEFSAYLESRGTYLYGHPQAEKDAEGYWHILLDKSQLHYQTLEHMAWAIGDELQASDSPYQHFFHGPNPFGLVWNTMAYADMNKVPALVQKLLAKKSIIGPTLITFDLDAQMFSGKDPFEAAGLDGFHQDARNQYLPDYYYDDWKSMYDTWGATAARQAIEVKGLANQKLILKAFDDAGVDIIPGTDTPARPQIVPGFSLHDELKEYSDAGISNWNVLRSATLISAKALRKVGQLGVVKAGAYADLILTKLNPVDDLSVLKRPDYVIAQGKVYDRTSLDQILVDVKTEVRAIHPPASKVAGLSREAAACAFGHRELSVKTWYDRALAWIRTRI